MASLVHHDMRMITTHYGHRGPVLTALIAFHAKRNESLSSITQDNTEDITDLLKIDPLAVRRMAAQFREGGSDVERTKLAVRLLCT